MGSGGLRAEQNVSYRPVSLTVTLGALLGGELGGVRVYTERQFSSAVQPLVIVPLPPVGKSV